MDSIYIKDILWILNSHTPILNWNKISIFFEWYSKSLQTGQYDVFQAGNQALKFVYDPKKLLMTKIKSYITQPVR